MNNQVMPAWFSAILAGLRGLCIAAGALMIGLHYDHTDAYKLLIEIAGASMIVGPMVWSVWVAGIQLYRAMAVGVAAGISMTAQGKAVTDDGAVINKFSAKASDATPPKAVTVASAKQIVADFGPSPKDIAAK